jgi:hypothetical protein
MLYKKILNFFLLVLFTSCSVHKKFTINNIQESNPIYQNQVYQFPELEGNLIISEKINSTIIKDFLDLDVSKKHKSIFENVWATGENSIPRLTFLEYKINVLNKNLYSVTFNTEGCGAYCEKFSKTYNFDISNGNHIILDAFFTRAGKKELLNLISNQKRKTIENYLIQLKTKNVIEEDKKYVNKTIQLYENCLEGIPFVTLEYFDFKISKGVLVITSDRCSNHATRALDDIGAYKYVFKKNNINSLLNNFGKKI